jgi:hypothetical protein
MAKTKQKPQQKPHIDTEEGKIYASAIIEVLGKPKEHVESALKGFVNQIKEDKAFKLKKEEYQEAKEHGDMWTTFVELEFEAKNISTMIGFCFDYMPSSIEIIEPEELKMNRDNISDFLNDLQAKLHGVDMLVKQAKTENIFLKKNINTILRNLVTVSLHNGPKDAKALSQITGVQEDEIKLFMKSLLKLEIAKEEKEVYSLIKK